MFSPFAARSARSLVTAASLIVSAVLASAATITVNTPADTLAGMNVTNVANFNASATRSLRGAITAVNNDPGGPHTIVLPADTYTLTIANATATTEEDFNATGDLDIRKAVTITGAGSATTIIRAGAAAGTGIDKIFSINPVAAVAGFPASISGVTLRWGRNQIVAITPGNNLGGAMDFDAGATGAGSLTLNDVVFDQNVTTNGDGGALALFDGGTVTLTSCTFTNNRAVSNTGTPANGGAVYVGEDFGHATAINFNSCVFSGNATTRTGAGAPGGGGAIYSFASGAGVSVGIHGCSITNNQTSLLVAGTSQDGGGVNAANLTIDQGTVVSGNTATRWGGGVYVSGGTSVISGSTIISNTAASAASARGPLAGGGGVFVNNGTTTITNSRIYGNNATGGGTALDTNLAAAVASAANNWWGTNSPAAALFGASGLTTSPYLVLSASASPTSVVSGQTTSTVTANLTRNNLNVAGFTVPNVTPVVFSATLGSVSPTNSTLASGLRTTVFTPGATGGTAVVTTTVDGQAIGTNIGVTVPPAITSANTTTFRVGAAGSFTVTATGSPVPTFSFTGALPAGVTLSAAGSLSGTPAAGTGNASYPITITATNGVSPNATQAFTLVVLSPWQYWQQQNFGANWTNPPIAGDTADPDGDGLENLEEYALGLNPNAFSVSPVVVDVTTGFLRLTTPKVSTASDLTYAVEVSGDLVAWTTAGTTVNINTGVQLQVSDNTPVSGATKRFIRLKITRS